MEPHGSLWPCNLFGPLSKSLKVYFDRFELSVSTPRQWAWGRRLVIWWKRSEGRWKRARKQTCTYLKKKQNLRASLGGKDSNSYLGIQYGISQSECDKDPQSICISELLEMHLFLFSMEKGNVNQGDISVGQCTLPGRVGRMSKWETVGPFELVVTYLALAKGYLTFGFGKGRRDKTWRHVSTKRQP